jgi:hypothetical protein
MLPYDDLLQPQSGKWKQGINVYASVYAAIASLRLQLLKSPASPGGRTGPLPVATARALPAL